MLHPTQLVFQPLQVTDEGTYTLVAHDTHSGQILTLVAQQPRREHKHLYSHVTLRCGESIALDSPLFDLYDVAGFVRVGAALGERAWGLALSQLCVRVSQQLKQRNEIVRLVDLPCVGPAIRWPIDPLPPIMLDEVSLWFGDGGVGKSFLALYAAGQLAVQGFEVLYCDWEMNGCNHRLRLQQLFGDELPRGVHYFECDAPLAQLWEYLNAEIRARNILFVIFDSVAEACGGDVGDPQTAIAYLKLARRLGVGSLHLAHVPKHAAQTAEKPFGTVFWHNRPRETWGIASSPGHSGEGIAGLVMQQRKTSFATPDSTPRVIQLVTEEPRVQVRSVGAPQEAPSDEQTLTARDQLRAALAEQPMTKKELRASCQALSYETFTKALQRERAAGGIVEGEGGRFVLHQTLM
jgi:hypothetical protein